MTETNQLILQSQSYILNESNIQSYLKYKATESITTHKKLKNNNQSRSSEMSSSLSSFTPKSFFTPKESDSLFWCYFIIANGDYAYETMSNRNTLVSKQLKIGLISKIRENKQIVKNGKFDSILHIENNLANEQLLSFKTLLALCAIDQVNVMIVTNKSYCEFISNDETPVYIIKETGTSTYSKQYGYTVATTDSLLDIRNHFYKVESIDKPIKSISSYKVSELTIIADKLGIETMNKETGKHKTKQDLYESIIQHF